MDGVRKSLSPSSPSSRPAMSPMYGRLNVTWIPPIPIGYWWRPRVTCRKGTCLGKTAGQAKIGLAFLLLAAAGCTRPPPQPQIPAGLHLSKLAFADLPQWSRADQARARLSFQRSCAVLIAKSDE